MNLLDVIKNTDEQKRKLGDLASTVTKEKEKINALYETKITAIKKERDETLANLDTLVNNKIDIICETHKCDCAHDYVVKTHGSCLTGRTSSHVPNPNHVIYTCLGCLKNLRENEISSTSNVLDFFGHDDALKVGYNSLAIVDYIRQIASDVLSNDDFSDSNIENIIMNGFGEVPEEYVKRS